MHLSLRKLLGFTLLLCSPISALMADFAAINTKIVCSYQFGESSESYPLDAETTAKFSGEWTSVDAIKARASDATFADIVVRRKDFYLLKNSSLNLVRACYQKFVEFHHPRSLYFTQVTAIKAFKADDHKCNGHQIIQRNDDNFYHVVNPIGSASLKSNLSKYNFAVVLEGLVYRSKNLGRNGIDELSKELHEANFPAIKSIASIHVMGFGGVGGDYNLQEIATAKARGITFLHTYAYDKNLMVYMDGTDPSKIIETDPDHGNIYEPDTVNKFIPDAGVRRQLGVDRSMAEKRVVLGDTKDFLQSLSNMIDAPWPLLIHCKGGRHKTGMFSLIIEYLAFNEAMEMDFDTPVSVPLYKNRVARWLDNKGGFFDIFFGGKLYQEINLHPAELRYFEHNKNVFREKNIEFVRGIVSEKYLDTEELKAKWAEIKKNFHQKLRAMAPFSIGQY
jgi:hypothetical protein